MSAYRTKPEKVARTNMLTYISNFRAGQRKFVNDKKKLNPN